MSVNVAVEQLLEVEANRGEGVCGPNSLAVGMARIGAEDQQMVAGYLKDLRDVDFGQPLHSLLLAGHMHEVELQMLKCYGVGEWLQSC